MLAPAPSSFEFIEGHPTTALFSYSENAPAPLLRARQGERLDVTLRNRLDEPTTIHWHGIRLPNAMDGVPFLTQPFVYTNETFAYSFALPDAGTYWYHPHCNSLEQLSRGLGGLLIVEEARDPGFDADVALNLRDFRLKPDGAFAPLFTPRQAARAGTLGAIRTANWLRAPTYDVPAGGLIRVRLAVTDVSRIYRLAVDGAAARIIALDGNPLREPRGLDVEPIGPGQRMDLVMRVDNSEESLATILDHSVQPPAPLARLRSVGPSLRRDLRDVTALPPNPIAEPDLSAAQTIPVALTASAEKAARNAFCGDLGYAFWALNGIAGAGESPDPFRPLAELKLGRSYVFEIHNRTPHAHPVHLHGMSFWPLRSDRRTLALPPTDTILVFPDERVDIALVADNPGDWLLHCHIIEHQATGMTGVIRVT